MKSDSESQSDPSFGQLSDFSQTLSPMLVKELRQGMRTNLFVIAFILLHSFMMLCVLTALSNPGSNSSDEFFWFIIFAVLLIVQPLRGFSALSSEYQLNTIDLIQLTRLDGWRITVGKWTALNAQGLLFITGVLPYLTIRYFLGNIDLLSDLLTLFLGTLGSAVATAVTVGCSVFGNIILRGMTTIGLAIATIITGVLIAETSSRSSGFGSDDAAALGFTVMAAAFCCFYFLSFAASRISPPAENHATLKRAVSFLFAFGCLLFLLTDFDEEMIWWAFFVILGASCVDALTEPLPVISRALAPFSTNFLTRLGGLFLSPGWISGICYFLLCLAVSLGLMRTSDNIVFSRENILALVSSANCLIFPLLVLSLSFIRNPKANFPLSSYLFVQAVVAGVTIVTTIVAEALPKRSEAIFSIAPLPSVLVSAHGGSILKAPQFLYFIFGTTILCVVVPLFLHRRDSIKFFKLLFTNNQ